MTSKTTIFKVQKTDTQMDVRFHNVPKVGKNRHRWAVRVTSVISEGACSLCPGMIFLQFLHRK